MVPVGEDGLFQIARLGKELSELRHRDAAALCARDAVDALAAEIRALPRPEGIQPPVQHDLRCSFPADRQLVFKVPVGQIVQVPVALHPHFAALVKHSALLFGHCSTSPSIIGRSDIKVNNCPKQDK